MKQQNLDSEDRKFLKDEMVQLILMYLLVLILIGIVGYAFSIILENAIPNFSRIIFFTIILLGYFGFVIYSLWPSIRELKHGMKGVTTGLISDKTEKNRYGWSGGIGDFTTQPKLIEFFFTIDKQDVWIEENYYNKFKINDQIDIHFSLRTGKIIKITKG